ncbi:MAG: DUF3784 domain-containing protein [Bacteroidota bacterium]
MLVVAIILSVLLFGLGFVLTKKNASTLLSGYNTMSAAEQEKFDLDGYIPFFRRFHWFLGSSMLGLSLLVYFLIGSGSLGYVVALYPIAAYGYFMLAGQRFQQSKKQIRLARIGAILMAVILIGVASLLYYGRQGNDILVTEEALVIEGMYGETISWNDISRIDQLDQLPSIDSRINGFSDGERLKGYFRTEAGDKVKMIVERANRPYLHIKRQEGADIYLSVNVEEANNIQNQFSE